MDIINQITNGDYKRIVRTAENKVDVVLHNGDMYRIWEDDKYIIIDKRLKHRPYRNMRLEIYLEKNSGTCSVERFYPSWWRVETYFRCLFVKKTSEKKTAELLLNRVDEKLLQALQEIGYSELPKS